MGFRLMGCDRSAWDASDTQKGLLANAKSLCHYCQRFTIPLQKF
jgi:hypothetical protein